MPIALITALRSPRYCNFRTLPISSLDFFFFRKPFSNCPLISSNSAIFLVLNSPLCTAFCRFHMSTTTLQVLVRPRMVEYKMHVPSNDARFRVIGRTCVLANHAALQCVTLLLGRVQYDNSSLHYLRTVIVSTCRAMQVVWLELDFCSVWENLAKILCLWFQSIHVSVLVVSLYCSWLLATVLWFIVWSWFMLSLFPCLFINGLVHSVHSASPLLFS